MFLLVPAYPGCPGSKAVKRSLLLLQFFAFIVFVLFCRSIVLYLVYFFIFAFFLCFSYSCIHLRYVQNRYYLLIFLIIDISHRLTFRISGPVWSNTGKLIHLGTN